MKRYRIILTALWALIVLTFFACDTDIQGLDEEVAPSTPSELTQGSSLFANNSVRERMRGSGIGGPMGFIYGRFLRNAGGRSAGALSAMRDYMSHGNMALNGRTAQDSTGSEPKCYTESYTESGDSYEYILDFGTGCDYYGEFMKGKLVEKGTFTNGSFRDEVEYFAFGGENWEISGTESYEGTWTEPDSTNLENETWNSTYSFVSDLTEKFTEEDFNEEISYQASGSEKWDESGFTVTSGSERVSTNSGESYESQIDSPLFMDFSCEEDDVFIFVSGSESGTYTYLDENGNATNGTYAIDYGSGACDNLITVTEDGVSEEIDVAEEWEVECEDHEEWEDDWEDEEWEDVTFELAFYEIEDALVLNSAGDGFTSGKLSFDIDSSEFFTIEFTSDENGNIAIVRSTTEDETEELEYEVIEAPVKNDDCDYYEEGVIAFEDEGEVVELSFESGCVNVAYLSHDEGHEEGENEAGTD